MRKAWSVGCAAVLAAAAACAQAPRAAGWDPADDGGAPHYDAGVTDATSPDDPHGGDAGNPLNDAGANGTTEDAEGIDAGPADADASQERDAPSAAPPDANDGAVETGFDAGTSPDATGVVGPVCDGVVGAGEYGGAGNQATTSSGQTWLMTWDATNLYVAITNATVLEGDVVYIAIDPGDAGPSGGATAGLPYDSTDVTTLPFAARLATYARDGATYAVVATGNAWGTPDDSAVRLCDDGATGTREEVIPWSLLGGLPASFGWTGYLAADGYKNPSGYIYGQMPQDDPSGSPANDDTFTKYFTISNTAAPGASPFAVEN